MERKAAQQNKNTSDELKQGLPTKAQAEVNKEGRNVGWSRVSPLKALSHMREKHAA